MRRSLITTLMLGLAMLFATTGAQAQVNLEADIPFEFHVGKKALTAGSYQITTDPNTGVIRFRGNGNSAATTSYAVGGGERVSDKSKLVFNRYGDDYFLAEMWRDDMSRGRAILQSRRERAVAQTETPTPVILAISRH